MTKTLLITSISEGAGKTAVLAALGQIASEQDRSVGYMKPLGTRLRSPAGKTLDEDPLLVRELLDLDAAADQMEPVVYSPSFIKEVIRGRVDIDSLHDEIRAAYDDIASGTDITLIEGGGSLATGGIANLTDQDVANLLSADVILITEYDKPADLDELLYAAETLDDRLAGVLFNRVSPVVEEELRTEVLPFLESQDIPVLGILPRVPDLAGVSVGELSSELGANELTTAGKDRTVEQFLVGAMGADAALKHFRRAQNAAVIVGGDRSDVHTTAIEAPGVSCLILTGAHRPADAVLRKANQHDVPVLLVSEDTLTAVERTESIIHEGRTRDEQTIIRMKELLHNHVPINQLL